MLEAPYFPVELSNMVKTVVLGNTLASECLGNPLKVWTQSVECCRPPIKFYPRGYKRAHVESAVFTPVKDRRGNWETIFTCLYPYTVQTRPLAGTASGMASDCPRQGTDVDCQLGIYISPAKSR